MARICQNRNVKRFDLAELAYERAMQTAESVFHRTNPANTPNNTKETNSKEESKKRKAVPESSEEVDVILSGDQYSDIYRQLERERLVVQMMGKRMEEEDTEDRKE